MEGATNLIQQSVAEYKTSINQLLEPSVAEQVERSLSHQQSSPFANLRSAYLQTKFVQENFPYVISMHILSYLYMFVCLMVEIC